MIFWKKDLEIFLVIALQKVAFVIINFLSVLFAGGPQPLSWAVRIKVAIDAARGLSFLHDAESQVIYRDFKASNILLDVVCCEKQKCTHCCFGFKMDLVTYSKHLSCFYWCRNLMQNFLTLAWQKQAPLVIRLMSPLKSWVLMVMPHLNMLPQVHSYTHIRSSY